MQSFHLHLARLTTLFHSTKKRLAQTSRCLYVVICLLFVFFQQVTQAHTHFNSHTNFPFGHTFFFTSFLDFKGDGKPDTTGNSKVATPKVTVLNNCGSSTLSTTAKGSLLWSTGATTSSIAVTIPGTYTVTQTINGVTSAEGSGIATPKIIPDAPVVAVANNCGSSTLSTTATGKLFWNTGATTSSITVKAPGSYTVTQSLNGCTSFEGSGITLPLEKPTVIASDTSIITGNCSELVTLGQNLIVTGTPAPSVVYKIGDLVTLSSAVFPLGTTIVTAEATNSCGSTMKNFHVKVSENQPPTINCKPNTTRFPSLLSTYEITGTELDATASDNCGVSTLTCKITGPTDPGIVFSELTTLNGISLNLGVSTLTWTATDKSGNSSTCKTKVTVKPNNVDPFGGQALNPSNNQVIYSNELKFGVKVMPNPSSNYFTLIFNNISYEKIKITVTDITGRIIEQKNNVTAQSTIQLGSNYLPGTYIAEIKQGNNKTLLKLVKMNR